MKKIINLFSNYKMMCIRTSLIILLIAGISKADIPTHCLQTQVVGKWTFQRTKPELKTDLADLYSERSTCGHKIPSNEKTSYLATELSDVEMDFNVEFKSDNTILYNAGGVRKEGRWTMVYDEGFEFSFDDKKSAFFAFLKYGKNDHKNARINSNWVSYCYTTLTGWYHLDNQWGCFVGRKDGTNDEITNGEATDKQVVLEGSITAKNFLQKREMLLGSVPIRFTELELLSGLKIDSEFKDHAILVDMINAQNGSWRAYNYEQFKGKTIREMNRLAGRIKSKNHIGYSDGNKYSRLPNGPINTNKKAQNKNYNHSTCINPKGKEAKPKNFSWRDKMKKPRSQGGCGSCFAAATLSMLEARLNILGKSVDLSLDHVLKCSYYNQGCDGGYSVLVSKFYKEFNVVTESCYQSFQEDQKCTAQCADKITIKDYYYVGGAYGKTDYESLLDELWCNGPIVVSFEPGFDFQTYKSGVYQVQNEIRKRVPWEKVDHSVVLVGWGEENGLPYWEILNSWGSSWGDNGYAKILQRKNIMSIESIGEAVIPVV